MTIPPVMDDIAAMLAFVEHQIEVKRGPVGCHGYCMSGPYALAAAARYPERVAAAASFYGTWLVSEAEESPHLSLGKVKGELYIACAEHDNLAPPPMVDELRTLYSSGPAPLVRSNSTPASITVSHSRSAGATTSRPPSATGSG
jgi:carboxymethylenebutenolidase